MGRDGLTADPESANLESTEVRQPEIAERTQASRAHQLPPRPPLRLLSDDEPRPPLLLPPDDEPPLSERPREGSARGVSLRVGSLR